MARTKKTPAKEAETKVVETKAISIDEFASSITAENGKLSWNGFEITVKPRLTMKEISRFTAIIVSLSFGDDGTYIPEVYEYAVSVATVMMYTDLQLPKDVEAQYKLLTFTDLYSQITDMVDVDQYSSAVQSALERIHNLTQANTDAIRKQAADVISAVDVLVKKIEDTFGGIDPEWMNGIAQALSSGKIDEEKLAKGVVKNRKIDTDKIAEAVAEKIKKEK